MTTLRISSFLLVWITVLSACNMTSRPTITVEFKEAPQVRGGEVVLLGGQPIGRTEPPRVRAGMIEVDIVLERNDTLRDKTIFLLTTASDNTPVFIAFPRGKEFVIALDEKPHRFRGASSRAELAMMVTKDELRGFLDGAYGVLEKVAEGILK